MSVALRLFLAERSETIERHQVFTNAFERKTVMQLLENAWLRGALWQWKK